MVKHVYIYSLNLLIFFHIVVFDVETALVILERLELHFFLSSLSDDGGQIRKFIFTKLSGILEKLEIIYFLQIYLVGSVVLDV